MTTSPRPTLDALERLIRAAHPEHPHVYWGRSGAAMLYDALRGVPRGTVILPAFICPSLTAMAVAAGKRVVHLDVDPDTMTVDPDILTGFLGTIDPSDAVLLLDHPFGYPNDSVHQVRGRYPELLIIEDCVRALGSRVGGRPVGRDGDWVLLSLYKATPGNDHGAVLLSRTPLDVRDGPPPKVALRQRIATLGPARLLYELAKRRRPDYRDTPRGLPGPRWSPTVGTPNRLCLERFCRWMGRVEQDVERRLEAARSIRQALSDVDAIRFIRPPAGGEPNAYFLSFRVTGGVSRNGLLAALHRRGFFLLRTWDLVPAFFGGLADTFPYGCSGSVHLADHVAHVPVVRFLSSRRRDHLIHALREVTESGRKAVVPTNGALTLL